MFAQIMLVFEAIKEGSKALQLLVLEVRSLKKDAIDKELETIKSDIATTLKQIEGAQSNEERKRLSLELANRMSR